MKLTYCSFVNSSACLGYLNATTVVILEGHHAPLDAANLALELNLIGDTGQFISLPIPEELEELYAAHVNRPISAEEARLLFEAKSIREWDDEAGERG